MGNLNEDPKEWLQRHFECEYCEECGGDAQHHTAVPLLGNWFARCDYPPDEKGNLHPTIAAYRVIDDLQIWDNGGETFDRYTVVWPDGSYLGMSEHPFHPQGFGQHGEGCVYFSAPPKKCHLGKRIEFADLPEDCQKCVKQDLRG